MEEGKSLEISWAYLGHIKVLIVALVLQLELFPSQPAVNIVVNLID